MSTVSATAASAALSSTGTSEWTQACFNQITHLDRRVAPYLIGSFRLGLTSYEFSDLVAHSLRNRSYLPGQQ
jgi:hypothetical protein